MRPGAPRRSGETYDAWLLDTRLPPSPRSYACGDCQARFRGARLAAPSIRPTVDARSWNWYHMRERAADSMIRLAREDYLDIRNGHMASSISGRCGTSRSPATEI